VTPPEFRGLQLAHDPTGRIGGLDLELIADERGTRLASWYQQIPLRVLPAFQFGPGEPALVYLINPTAGLFDGDGHLVRLTARAGTRAVVVGQSATRIHPALTGFATQQWDIRVESGAVLVVLPGPTIPFAGSRYYQRVSVSLDDGAHFAWGDIGLPGRYSRGEASERFRFDRLVQQFEVRRGGDLVCRDRFSWHGPWDDDAIRWHSGEHSAYGMLFVTGAAESTVAFPTARGDTILRYQGDVERVVADVVRDALAFGGRRGGEATWLSTRSDLATNHWFSASLSMS
jgi:urease accessory protein